MGQTIRQRGGQPKGRRLACGAWEQKVSREWERAQRRKTKKNELTVGCCSLVRLSNPDITSHPCFHGTKLTHTVTLYLEKSVIFILRSSRKQLLIFLALFVPPFYSSSTLHVPKSPLSFSADLSFLPPPRFPSSRSPSIPLFSVCHCHRWLEQLSRARGGKGPNPKEGSVDL